MRFAAAAAAVLVASPACAHAHRAPTVHGDGHATTESRRVEPFQSIQLEASADVSVKVGSGPAVRVTVDENLQRHVLTTVRHGALVIDLDDDVSIRPTGDVRVEVEVPELRRFAVDGSGDVVIDGGAGDLELSIGGSGELRWRGEAAALRADIEGSGDLRLDGRAASLRAAVEGSGDIDARKLAATDVEASIEGSGNIDVNVSGGKLSATVEGSGDIHWSGTASIERVRVSGSGEVARRD